MVRIIVKSGYMKGKSHKEYYVNYIATREGVEKFKSDYGNMKETKKSVSILIIILYVVEHLALKRKKDY